MTEVRQMTEQDIETWRQSIRADTFANYYISMAVAVLRAEGAEAALPWLQEAEKYPARRATQRHLTVTALRALGRTEEAERIHRATLAELPRYDLDGLIESCRIHRESAGISAEVTAAAHAEAIAAAERYADRHARVLLAMERAKSLWSLDRREEALAIWDRLGESRALLATASADDLASLAGIVYTLRQAGDQTRALAVAVELLAAAAGLVPCDDGLMTTLVRSLHQCSSHIDTQARRKVLTEAVELIRTTEFGDPAPLALLGRHLVIAGALPQAQAVFRRAAAIDPGNLEHAAAALNAALVDQKVTDALSGFEDLLTQHPTDASLRGWYGRALFVAGRTADAQAAFSGACATPEFASAEAGIDYALYQIAVGQPEAALAWITQVLARVPRNALIMSNHSYALLCLGRREEALKAAQAAVEAAPRRSWTLSTLGLAQQALGNEQEAASAFRSAAEQQPHMIWLEARLRPLHAETLVSAQLVQL